MLTKEEFEKEGETLYRVIGIHTSAMNHQNHVEAECETFERAVEIAEEMSENYRHVYIQQETEYIYQFN